MNYFEGLAFYLVRILILIPAMILGMMEKKQGWYQLASSVVILVLVFANRREEFLFLTLFLAWSISLIWLYLHLRRTRGRKERLFHLILILALLPLAACKISPLFSGSLFAFTGISYLTFRVLQILIEIYDGVIGSLSLPETLAFFLFFPSFSSGPIDRSRRFGEDYHRQRSREEYLSLCGDGILHLLVGAVYKFVLAAFFFKAMGYLDSEEASWYLWIGYAYAYSGYLFFDFAGYSRMAKGCGCILGTSLPDNFRAPFISKDIREFWDRWHISLSHWFRDFVFTRFVMYSTKRKWFKDRLQRACAGFLLNMTIMGMWHGLTPSYVLYGIYHGCLLALTEIWQKKSAFHKRNKNKKWYQILSWAVTMQLVIFGFFLFSGKLIELVQASQNR